MGDEDTKIPELLQEMNAIYESQSHFSNIIDVKIRKIISIIFETEGLENFN